MGTNQQPTPQAGLRAAGYPSDRAAERRGVPDAGEHDRGDHDHPHHEGHRREGGGTQGRRLHAVLRVVEGHAQFVAGGAPLPCVDALRDEVDDGSRRRAAPPPPVPAASSAARPRLATRWSGGSGARSPPPTAPARSAGSRAAQPRATVTEAVAAAGAARSLRSRRSRPTSAGRAPRPDRGTTRGAHRGIPRLRSRGHSSKAPSSPETSLSGFRLGRVGRIRSDSPLLRRRI